MSPKAQRGLEKNSESQAEVCESQELTPKYSKPRKEYMKLTAIFVEVPGGYMGYVEELPGANTEGTTLEETRENLQDAVREMMLADDLELTEERLEANREFTKEVISELSLTGRVVQREELLLPVAA